MLYPTELLNKMSGYAAFPDHFLIFKMRFFFMLLQNFNTLRGHVNSSRCILEKVTTNPLFWGLATAPEKGNGLAFPRMPCTRDEKYPNPSFIRRKFLVRFCFSMTVNKAQVQSIKTCLGLDLNVQYFSHVQLYVSLSRTSHPSNIV